MRLLLIIIVLTLSNCKSMSGVRQLSKGGKTVITVKMVSKMLSMFVILQEKDSVMMSGIKIIKSNSKKTCQIQKHFVSLQNEKININK